MTRPFSTQLSSFLWRVRLRVVWQLWPIWHKFVTQVKMEQLEKPSLLSQIFMYIFAYKCCVPPAHQINSFVTKQKQKPRNLTFHVHIFHASPPPLLTLKKEVSWYLFSKVEIILRLLNFTILTQSSLHINIDWFLSCLNIYIPSVEKWKQFTGWCDLNIGKLHDWLVESGCL